MRKHRRKGQVLRLAASAAALFALTAPRAAATVRIQQEAISHGYPASNCGYCHTFDNDHMKEQAKKQGLKLARLDCYACHGNRLPKRGTKMLNERGLFLAAAKRQFKAEKVDGAWLKSYHEPVAPKPTPTPKPKPSPKE